MITTEGVSVSRVQKELDELEASYRAKKKKLRALLAVLKEEAGVEENSNES